MGVYMNKFSLVVLCAALAVLAAVLALVTEEKI